ncbi:hypothetical protein [Salinibacillus xinjiangensis]|uniref:Uncharacterized protein n=1 Tax=Salinibacillus xinjiangensis TaxID=1229268 RepID=A0A6G1X624_9BACI|nr:hypothetical protein [Salinibacillus xinjiangensis]MRG86356.1 hypothetical protein [Salinibacillus xinjiangensis]
MQGPFLLRQNKDWIKLRKIDDIPNSITAIYIDHQLTALLYKGNEFQMGKGHLPPGQHHLSVKTFHQASGYPPLYEQQFRFVVLEQQKGSRQRTFKPGDVLVSSDNVMQQMTGYMGHAALVINENELIESPGGYPAIKQDTIQQFLEKHPEHAQFRPIQEQMGVGAAEFAKQYLATYEKNLEKGEEKPVFFFSLSELTNPWAYVYCSKLVWLSYYYGANFEMKNDHLWFSPEDLYTVLGASSEFEKVYEHPNVLFKVDT